MKTLLEYLTKAIVANPKAVKVSEETTEDGYVTLNLSVDPQDMGVVIGKGGKTIRALRNLVRVKAIKENKKVNIELIEKDEN